VITWWDVWAGFGGWWGVQTWLISSAVLMTYGVSEDAAEAPPDGPPLEAVEL
jgi:hypothetical protein